jgi:hypothetical protein
MTYSSRFWLYAPTLAFLAIAAAVMLHWWTAAGAFEKKLAALKGHEAVPGITLDWSAATVGGFPFRIDADFTNFSVKGAGAHGPFAWTSEKFALHALTYGRPKDVFEAAGKQQVRWTDASGGVHATAFLPARFHASAVTDKRGLARADIDILDAGSKDFTAARLQLHMRRDPDGSDLDLMLRADTFKSGKVDRKLVQVYATLTKSSAFAPLLRGDAAWPQVSAKWRAAGGAAKLSQIAAPGLSADALLSPFY